MSTKDQIILHLETSRVAKTQPWPENQSVTMLSEHIHNSTGKPACIVAVDFDTNEIELWFDLHLRWGGTYQAFKEEFTPA